MGQQVWTFRDQMGMDHSFGVYHGEESGHVLCYLDNQILIIDFNILQDKEYSFYVQEELLNFRIIKTNEEFRYDLQVDTESNTPLNLQRKSEQRDNKKMIMIGIVMALLFIKLIVYLIVKNLDKAN